MSDNTQKTAFLEFEGNDWYTRNENFIRSFSGNDDPICKAIHEYNITGKNILEIGCSAGYRLNFLKKLYPQTDFYGIDPSDKALEYGKKSYQNINLSLGTMDDLSQYKDEFFDAVIVGFVFYVVDRNLLLKSVAEIDRVLKNKGVLVIIDFYYPKPYSHQYHHLKELNAFTYKQAYEEVFIASKLYHLFSKSTIDHISHRHTITDNYSDLCSLVIVKKDIDASYQ
jgi:ubiquinone/menaquinone biosynthesis C-methylase UbiE